MSEGALRRAGAAVAASLFAAACAGSPSGSAPSAVASSSATPSSTATAAGSQLTFTSALYAYSIVLPTGWSAAPATRRWDGTKSPGSDDLVNDRFVTGVSASAWARAAPVSGNLGAYVAATIAANAEFHGSTCGTEPPDAVEPITIGGETGSLLAWDCGILINVGVTIHAGNGYFFGFRDPAIHAATDPLDHDLFVAMLASVSFAG